MVLRDFKIHEKILIYEFDIFSYMDRRRYAIFHWPIILKTNPNHFFVIRTNILIG